MSAAKVIPVTKLNGFMDSSLLPISVRPSFASVEPQHLACLRLGRERRGEEREGKKRDGESRHDPPPFGRDATPGGGGRSTGRRWSSAIRHLSGRQFGDR